MGHGCCNNNNHHPPLSSLHDLSSDEEEHEAAETETITVLEGFEDLLSTSTLARKVLSSGDGGIIADTGDDVTYTFTGYTLDDDSTTEFTKDQRQTVTLGTGETLPAIDIGIKSMEVGSTIEIHCVSRFGYGPSTDDNKSLEDVPLKLIVTIVSATKQQQQSSAPAVLETVVAKATSKKEMGNSYFKAGRFHLAARCYQNSFKLVSQISPDDFEEKPTPMQMAAMRNVLISSLNNMANVFLKLGDATESRKASSTVLKIDPNNCKALYRFGLASFEAKDFNSAIHSLEKAAKLDTSSREIRKVLIKSKLKLKEEKEVEQKMYERMMAGALKEKQEEENNNGDAEEASESVFDLNETESDKKFVLTNADLVFASVVITLLAVCIKLILKSYA